MYTLSLEEYPKGGRILALGESPCLKGQTEENQS